VLVHKCCQSANSTVPVLLLNTDRKVRFQRFTDRCASSSAAKLVGHPFNQVAAHERTCHINEWQPAPGIACLIALPSALSGDLPIHVAAVSTDHITGLENLVSTSDTQMCSWRHDACCLVNRLRANLRWHPMPPSSEYNRCIYSCGARQPGIGGLSGGRVWGLGSCRPGAATHWRSVGR
jgi:hypothetical protein